MDHFLPAKNMQSPNFQMDNSDPSQLSAPSLTTRNSNSTSTSSSSSWSMDTDPQLYPTDVSFWQDMTPYLCSSPTSPYKYPYDETPGATHDDDFFAATERGPRRVRNKEASPEVILRRRAQNRASQRAYRDRKDRRVKELETELATLAASHEKLEGEHASLCAKHKVLMDKEVVWERERERRESREERGSGGGADHDEESWSCDGEVRAAGSINGGAHGENTKSIEVAAGAGQAGNFVVKVMICKRCFGESAHVAGVESRNIEGTVS